jgi:plasmid stabilization system protein ParE
VSGYILSADADFDLDGIWEYIAADNIEAANRWSESCSMRLNPSRKHQGWATNAKT